MQIIDKQRLCSSFSLSGLSKMNSPPYRQVLTRQQVQLPVNQSSTSPNKFVSLNTSRTSYIQDNNSQKQQSFAMNLPTIKHEKNNNLNLSKLSLNTSQLTDDVLIQQSDEQKALQVLQNEYNDLIREKQKQSNELDANKTNIWQIQQLLNNITNNQKFENIVDNPQLQLSLIQKDIFFKHETIIQQSKKINELSAENLDLLQSHRNIMTSNNELNNQIQQQNKKMIDLQLTQTKSRQNLADSENVTDSMISRSPSKCNLLGINVENNSVEYNSNQTSKNVKFTQKQFDKKIKSILNEVEGKYTLITENYEQQIIDVKNEINRLTRQVEYQQSEIRAYFGQEKGEYCNQLFKKSLECEREVTKYKNILQQKIKECDYQLQQIKYRDQQLQEIKEQIFTLETIEIPNNKAIISKLEEDKMAFDIFHQADQIEIQDLKDQVDEIRQQHEKMLFTIQDKYIAEINFLKNTINNQEQLDAKYQQKYEQQRQHQKEVVDKLNVESYHLQQKLDSIHLQYCKRIITNFREHIKELIEHVETIYETSDNNIDFVDKMIIYAKQQITKV